ncbi:MAG: hypothetical protein KAI95_14090, partial [Bacteroidales bacterium]|nr:hypothetical protein [Bacteroidales bacterium]
MKPLNSINLILVLLLSIAGQACNMKSQSPQPNIVLIFVDDWAWNGTPIPMDEEMPNSRMPVLQMPNLEKLASH